MAHAIELVLVVAAARNRVIGRDGTLPWRIPSDLKRFKATTMGHPCLMGRRTWESIGRPLPGRDMIVVTRGPVIDAPGVLTVATPEDGVALARDCACQRGVNAVMVIGGGALYAALLPVSHRIIYTEVQADIAGDTVFPVLPADWQEVASEAPKPEAGDDYAVVIRTFVRAPKPAG